MRRSLLRLALFAGVFALFTGFLVSVPLSACVTAAPVAAPGGAPPADSTEEALGAARARWEAAGLDAYRFVYEASCFCPPEVRGPFVITVRDGAVQEVTYEGRAVEPVAGRHPTVDVLFGMLDEAFDREAETVRVTYDAALGYPVSAFVDYAAQMADEELRFEIRDLTRLGG